MSSPPTTRASAKWEIISRVTALPEFWAHVDEHIGIVGALKLMTVCKASRAGGLLFLSQQKIVVSGGSRRTSDVFRLDLATMRWLAMPPLLTARNFHASCVVRGKLVVLAGETATEDVTSSVEMLEMRSSVPTRGGEPSSAEEGAFVEVSRLSCGGLSGAAALVVDETDSAAGQVLLLGGSDGNYDERRSVQLVDLATGACRQQPDLLNFECVYSTAQRLSDGRIVVAGGDGFGSAEMWGPPEQGETDVAWRWRELPRMTVARAGSRGCMLSDGRFAVFGGRGDDGNTTTSCEALAIDDGDACCWTTLPPMKDPRVHFACWSVAGGAIVAGGNEHGLPCAELYDEELNRWLRLPCDFPLSGDGMGCALL